MEIGEHCSFKSCKRLDFLPFTCLQCHGVFCKEHSSPEQHQCESTDQLTTSSHQDRSPSDSELRSFECSASGCRRREMLELRCPECKETFCLQHRHQVQHNCPALAKHATKTPGHRAATEVRRDRVSASKDDGNCASKAWSPAKTARLESTKTKVLLMKLKMKAEGSDAIPVTERVYYQVQLPQGEVVAMYFSREWSVGKVVDYVAQKCKLRNKNNDPHAKERLVLCGVSGEPAEMSQPLGSLLEAGLPNGATLTLKYS